MFCRKDALYYCKIMQYTLLHLTVWSFFKTVNIFFPLNMPSKILVGLWFISIIRRASYGPSDRVFNYNYFINQL